MTKLNEPVEARKEPTPEEIAAYKKQMIDFYSSELELLRPQAEYTKLLADIEEDRLRRQGSIIQLAQLRAQMAEKTSDSERKLKKD